MEMSLLKFHYIFSKASWVEIKLTNQLFNFNKDKKNLHATVRHGHGIVRRGITGDLAVVGTGGGGKNVARVDKVWAGSVSSTVGPVKDPGKHLPSFNVMSLSVVV